MLRTQESVVFVKANLLTLLANVLNCKETLPIIVIIQTWFKLKGNCLIMKLCNVHRVRRIVFLFTSTNNLSAMKMISFIKNKLLPLESAISMESPPIV